ncbi:MAG: hypothetical protein ABL857_00065 [Rickettsiales bacterium]
MFFRKLKINRKTPTPPIVVADQMLMNAMIIACGYLQNKKFIPTENDLQMFDVFVEELHMSHCAAIHISNQLHLRVSNE